jgi:hypothetical protein
MRYIAALNLNSFEVGKGYGSNKKQAKMTAGRMALQGMVPNVYQEWVQSFSRKKALNNLGLDVDRIMKRDEAHVKELQYFSESSSLKSESMASARSASEEKENLNAKSPD